MAPTTQSSVDAEQKDHDAKRQRIQFPTRTLAFVSGSMVTRAQSTAWTHRICFSAHARCSTIDEVRSHVDSVSLPSPCCAQIPRIQRAQHNYSETCMRASEFNTREAKRFCRHGNFHFTHGPEHIHEPTKLTKKKWKSTCFEMSTDIRTEDFNSDFDSHPDILRCFSQTRGERQKSISVRSMPQNKSSFTRQRKSSLIHS